ncbi:MAG: DNA polymerase III subunit alpha, partial [Coriobacteriales bacterium]|nr:DNA polymerase III subunit alpha [Coriobacteriales bacterium]
MTNVEQFEQIKLVSNEQSAELPTSCRQAGGFVHLHVHTEYSFLDGASKVSEICAYAKELGMPALAITDHGYMYGCSNFYQECLKTGIKPILGCEIYMVLEDTILRSKEQKRHHMLLLAKNNRGYKNLMKIVSIAAVENFYQKPLVTIDLLKKYHEGIIATSACMAGAIPRFIDKGSFEQAKNYAKLFSEIFGKEDFYIELQNQGPEVITDSGTTEPQLNDSLVAIANELGLKIIGTNDVHYIKRDDAYTQDLMLCIGMNKKVDDPNRMKFKNDQFYLKSYEEMQVALGDYPECLTNTLEVADKCNVTLEFDNIILPYFPLPQGHTNESLLKENCLKGLAERYGKDYPQEVQKRFEHEYQIICDKGFPAYFLVVQEFCHWARENGIRVGPGRGSAAGSIVSYALGVTDLDPLENGLIFERFLSPERTEMPDIDIDFEDERRAEVVQHVRDLYGAEKIAHVITFSKMQAKQAVNDAARVLNYPVFIGRQISKMIDADLDSSLSNNPDFRKKYESDADVAKIVDAAKRLEGIVRGEGVHASAVIICRDDLTEYVPVKRDTKGTSEIITQFDGEMTAKIGLLKMDFLGLKQLGTISTTLELIKNKYDKEINLSSKEIFIDKPTYDLIVSGKTAGVFQLEGDGMKGLAKQMNASQFEDIVAVLALYRPGPLNSGFCQDYVSRKMGSKSISYYDNRLASILAPTYGTIVYQEQVMQISVTMCGFSLGESDKVRKAVAKKKLDLMCEKVQVWADGQEETMEMHWINGAIRNGYSEKVAKQIWTDVLNFAEYAFNKSHSAAYAKVALQTAYLKAHYPKDYMASVLTGDIGSTDKIVKDANLCKKEGITVDVPDINESIAKFNATDAGIRFALAGIKGVGPQIAEKIIAQRNFGGHYKNMMDFLIRNDADVCNKRVLEALIKSGCFDSTGYTRRQLWTLLHDGGILEITQKRKKQKMQGQSSIFDLAKDEDVANDFVDNTFPEPDGVEWGKRQKLNFEKEVLGLYITDNPLSDFEQIIQNETTATIAKLLDEK